MSHCRASRAQAYLALPRILELACLVLLLLLLAAGGAAAAASLNSCMECHGDKKVQFLDSAHARNDLTCTSCHGGDPARLDGSAHKAKNFRGKPDRAKVPQFCGSCHSQESRMRQYGLPTDQLQQYMDSEHGRALVAKRNTSVAVCTDCHGTHRILPKADPASSVFPANIPATCARCHADERLMRKQALPFRTAADFKDGVHGKALRQGNPRAPSCATCHSSHGAAPPGVTEVANVCGRCHDAERDAFRQSIHKKAMDRNQIKECLSCHDQHATTPTSPAMYDRVCRTCHDLHSAPFQVGQQIKAQTMGAEEAILTARKTLTEDQHHGVDIRPLMLRLQDAEAELARAGSLSHTLSPSRVEDLARPARSMAEEVQATSAAHAREERIWQVITIVGLLALLGVLLWLAYVYRLLRRAMRQPLDEAIGLPGPGYLRLAVLRRLLHSRLGIGRDRLYALLLFGIDGYEKLDPAGRAQGAARLAAILRAEVRGQDRLAQAAPDRFALVLAGADAAQARAVAERLQAQLRQETPAVPTSAGIALPGPGGPADALDRAARALDESAGSGSIRVEGEAAPREGA